MSTRAHFLKTLVDSQGNVLPGTVVKVLDPGASTLVTDTLWTDNNTTTSSLTNPFVATSGVISLYLDTPRRIRLSVTPPGGSETFFEDLDVILQPQAITTITDGTTSVSTEMKVKFVGQNGIIVTTDDDAVNAQARVIIDGSGVTPGYVVVQSNATPVAQEPNLNFSSKFTVTDDATNHATDVDLPLHYQSVVAPDGTVETQRSKVKFTQSGATTVTVTDDAANDQTLVNVNSPTDTDYYQTVVAPDGTVESQRAKIKFTNSGNAVVTVTDDAGNNQTVVDIGDDHGLVTKTTNYTMVVADRIVLANGTITITLPPSPTVGLRYTVKNIGTGTVTVTPSSGTIDGAASTSMAVQYSSLDMLNDGTNWFTV